MIDALYNAGLGLLPFGWWTAAAWPVLWILLKIVCILAPLMGAVAYLTLWERKLLGFMQVRHGPNRVGPLGLLQPITAAMPLTVPAFMASINGAGVPPSMARMASAENPVIICAGSTGMLTLLKLRSAKASIASCTIFLASMAALTGFMSK